ncbi:MAG: ATP-binding cassette domain-containing protein [Rhodobacteraceae bacterium]|nr:ATP-binding cassette domain-containing protein [Paracoccaceae bacterium]
MALALAETLLPLRRGFSDLGRMVGAANRIAPRVTPARPVQAGLEPLSAPLLALDCAEGILTLQAGEAVVVTGPTGAGKSTLLMQIAGLGDDGGISIKGHRPNDRPENALRALVAALPQRSALIAGTVRDNLSLAGDMRDRDMWDVLDATALAPDIRARGGLDGRLGEGGAGLSGGQAPRLTLARVLLKHPQILLLDEPTEGLDAGTADAVLRNVRDFLPNALIVVAMHRSADRPIFDRIVRLSP